MVARSPTTVAWAAVIVSFGSRANASHEAVTPSAGGTLSPPTTVGSSAALGTRSVLVTGSLGGACRGCSAGVAGSEGTVVSAPVVLLEGDVVVPIGSVGTESTGICATAAWGHWELGFGYLFMFACWRMADDGVLSRESLQL